MTLLQKRIRKAMRIIEDADEKISADTIANRNRAPHMSEKDLEFCIQMLYEVGLHFTKK